MGIRRPATELAPEHRPQLQPVRMVDQPRHGFEIEVEQALGDFFVRQALLARQQELLPEIVALHLGDPRQRARQRASFLDRAGVVRTAECRFTDAFDEGAQSAHV